MEPDHVVLVAHETLSLLQDAISRLLAGLRVERTQDNRARRIILHERVLVSLDAALGELCVQVVGPARSLLHDGLAAQFGADRLEQLRASVLELLELLLLQDVGELLADELELLLVEDVDVRVDVVLQPRVPEGVLSSRSLLRRLRQHGLHEVDGLLRDRVLVLDLLFQLFNCVQVADLVRLERHVAVQHRVEADASAPDVDREALVAHVLHDLRCDVRRRATLLEQQLVDLDLLADAEVAYLDVAVAVQQDVVELDVTVRDAILVQVGDALHDLPEDELGVLLTELTALAHVVQEVSAGAELHDDHVVLVSLERLQDLDVVRVAQRLEYSDLVHDLLLLALFLHEVHVDRLDGAQLARQPMQAQVDLAEGTFTQHLANLVQLELRLGRLLVLAEAVKDQLADEVDLLGARRQAIWSTFVLLDVVQNVVVACCRVGLLLRRAALLTRLGVAGYRTGLLERAHIFMSLVLIEALRHRELTKLTHVILGLRHGRQASLQRATDCLVVRMLLLLTLMLQVCLCLLIDHVVLACALNRAILRRFNLSEMREREHLLLANVGAPHYLGLASDADDRHVCGQFRVRLLAALLALTRHDLTDVLLLLEVLVHVLLADLVVSSRCLHHIDFGLLICHDALGYSRAVLTLWLAVSLSLG